MSARGRKWIWGVLATVAVVGASSYFVVGRRSGGAEAMPSAATTLAKKEQQPTAVTTALITPRSIERTVSIVGTLRGFEEIEIGALVDGRIARILHEVGDVVRPGELLLEIDDTDYRLAVDETTRAMELELSRLGLKALPEGVFDVRTLPAVLRAETVERNAAAVFERYSKLVQSSAITTDDYEKAELNLRTAQLDVKQQVLEAEQTLASVRHRAATLATVRKKLDDVRVVVPAASALAGEPNPQINLVSTAAARATVPALTGAVTVAERFVSEGEIVRASQGTKLFRLVIDDPLKLQAAVPERFSGKVAVGQPVRVSVEAYPDRVFQGVVARVNPTVDEASRTFVVEVSIPNKDRALKAGSFASAVVSTGVDAQTVTVPEEAVVKFAGVTKVFVVDGDKVRAIPVELGTRLEMKAAGVAAHWIEVRGVPSGRHVVTTGHSQLSDGSLVRVRSEATDAASATAARPESEKEVR